MKDDHDDYNEDAGIYRHSPEGKAEQAAWLAQHMADTTASDGTTYMTKEGRDAHEAQLVKDAAEQAAWDAERAADRARWTAAEAEPAEPTEPTVPSDWKLTRKDNLRSFLNNYLKDSPRSASIFHQHGRLGSDYCKMDNTPHTWVKEVIEELHIVELPTGKNGAMQLHLPHQVPSQVPSQVPPQEPTQEPTRGVEPAPGEDLQALFDPDVEVLYIASADPSYYVVTLRLGAEDVKWLAAKMKTRRRP